MAAILDGASDRRQSGCRPQSGRGLQSGSASGHTSTAESSLWWHGGREGSLRVSEATKLSVVWWRCSSRCLHGACCLISACNQCPQVALPSSVARTHARTPTLRQLQTWKLAVIRVCLPVSMKCLKTENRNNHPPAQFGTARRRCAATCISQ